LQIGVALPKNDSGGRFPSGLCARQQACSLQSVSNDVDAGLTFLLEGSSPVRKFIAPGLDRKDIASRLVHLERASPSIVAIKLHGYPMPIVVLLTVPQQGGLDRLRSVPINIRPYLNPFPGQAFDRVAAAIDQRIDILNQKSAACRGAFKSLNRFVHGDAIEIGKTVPSGCAKGKVPDIYRSRSSAVGSPGTQGKTQS